MKGAEAYRAVKDEMYLPGERGAKPAHEVLESLDAEVVEIARGYAKRAHKRWPPRASSHGIVYVRRW